jgi:hypothetical protein
MALIADIVFDNGLTLLTINGTRLDVNYGSEATTYAEATSTKSCGFDTVALGSPVAGSPSGRSVVVPAIAAGAVTDTQIAGWWSVTDGIDTLYATGTLTPAQNVTSGNTFSLDAITITITDAIAV